MWQCTPSKPGWHLQTYSLKTSPRLVGAMTSQAPSFLQGLGLQGPKGYRIGKIAQSFARHIFSSRTLLPQSTCLCQVTGVSTEAVRTDTDEGILSNSCHTSRSIVANIHLTVVAWTWEGKQTEWGLVVTVLAHCSRGSHRSILISSFLSTD